MDSPAHDFHKWGRAILVSAEMPDQNFNSLELLEELSELVDTMGVEVVDTVLVRLKKANAAYFIGSGKAEEIGQLAHAQDCHVIIFDNELTPGQQHNWEKLTKLPVIDRHEVILDIFAKRAKTKEACLQVELAQVEYYLPRLTRAWAHLSRQRGGGALQRGEGETQLEMDQRILRKKIEQLKRELEEVVQHREVQRKKRLKVPYPTATIVGYTNAGKSSLLKYLTGAEVLVEDKLFATLDPTTRRLNLPNGQAVLISDTVGFIRNLPHRLINAFKATLEEALTADFLIHVVDLSNPSWESHIETTNKVLEELGASHKRAILVFNKIDLIEDELQVKVVQSRYPGSCLLSLKTGEGVKNLLSRMEMEVGVGYHMINLCIPHHQYDVIHKLHEYGIVKKEEVQDDGVYILAAVPDKYLRLFAKYVR